MTPHDPRSGADDTQPVILTDELRHALALLHEGHDLFLTGKAGTGKSTVILERIKYLEACGVPADDITVLSFTNAAADNIKEKNPAIGSMTTEFRDVEDLWRRVLEAVG